MSIFTPRLPLRKRTLLSPSLALPSLPLSPSLLLPSLSPLLTMSSAKRGSSEQGSEEAPKRALAEDDMNPWTGRRYSKCYHDILAVRFVFSHSSLGVCEWVRVCVC